MNTALILGLFIMLTQCSYKSGDNVYAMTFATCENDGCDNCEGKCIKFRDHDGSTKDVNGLKVLATKCWDISSCAHFPKAYAFQTDKDCSNNCEVNIFPGFSKSELNNIDGLYNAKGYVMMCTEHAATETPFPDICSIAE